MVLIVQLLCLSISGMIVEEFCVQNFWPFSKVDM